MKANLLELSREFTIVAKYKNLSDAAKELHTTQPVLSKHLAILEQETGGELFFRNTTPMELTAYGESFLKSACSLVAKQGALSHLIETSKVEGSKAIIRVGGGAIESGVFSLLIEAKSELMNLKEVKNTVLLRIDFISHQLPIALLSEHELDIVIEPFSKYINLRGLSSYPIIQDRGIIIVEKSHPLSQKAFVQFEELRKESFVTLNNNADTGIRKCVREMCERYGFAGGLPADFQLRDADNYLIVFLEGLYGGIVIMPETRCKFLPRFVQDMYSIIPIRNEGCIFDIRAFFRDDNDKSVELFIQTIKHIKENKDIAENYNCHEKPSSLIEN